MYGERRFLLNELNNYTSVIAVSTSSGNFGLKTTYNGFSDYNETQIGLAYGRSLGKKIDVGVQFNYNAVQISGYGNASAITFEAGTIFHLTCQQSCWWKIWKRWAGKNFFSLYHWIGLRCFG